MCEHFIFMEGSPGYSEYTPGWDASIDCRKAVFNARTLNDIDLKAALSRAQTCKHFKIHKECQ